MSKDERIKCFSYNGVVNRKGVMILGIPTFEEITRLNQAADRTSTEDMAETIIIPENKPDIEQINQMQIKMCLTGAWLMTVRSRIFIEATIWQKIIYTSCDSDQPVHTVENEFPISDSVSISSIPPETDVFETIVLAPFDAFVQKIDSRTMFKNVITRVFFFEP